MNTRLKKSHTCTLSPKAQRWLKRKLRAMGFDDIDDGSGLCLICQLETEADAGEDDIMPESARRPIRWWLR
jgi:hypothetical protein